MELCQCTFLKWLFICEGFAIAHFAKGQRGQWYSFPLQLLILQSGWAHCKIKQLNSPVPLSTIDAWLATLAAERSHTTLHLGKFLHEVCSVFAHEGYVFALPVLGNTSLIWNTYYISLSKNDQIHERAIIQQQQTVNSTYYMKVMESVVPAILSAYFISWL